jgi:hypothetical protein
MAADNDRQTLSFEEAETAKWAVEAMLKTPDT